MALPVVETRVPGPHSAAEFEAEALHLAPGTQSVALFSRLCIERGEGAILFDADGNRYIDLLAGVGVASLGYAHPRYCSREPAVVGHVGASPPGIGRSWSDCSPIWLGRPQPPQFYSSVARPWKLRCGWQIGHGKTEIAGFWGGFHGKTGGVLRS